MAVSVPCKALVEMKLPVYSGYSEDCDCYNCSGSLEDTFRYRTLHGYTLYTGYFFVMLLRCSETYMTL